MMTRTAPLLLAAAAWLALIAPAGAEVYRWTDKNGRVQYGDQPPPDVQARPITAKPASGSAPAPSKTISEQDKDYQKRQLAAQEKATEQAKGDKQAQTKRDNCAAARSRLASFEQGGRIYTIDEKGERKYLEDADRPAAIESAQKSVAEWCN